MKNERFERYIYTGVTAILVLIAAVFVVFLFLERSAVFAFLGKVRFVLAPVIYGAVLAFLMSPVYNWCYRLTVYTGKSGEPKARFKNEKLGAFFGRSVGTAVSLVFLLAVIVSLSSMIIPQLYSSIVGIINMMPEYFQNVYDWLTDFFVNNPPVEQAILNIYEQSAQYFQNWMETDLMSNLSNFQNFQNIEKILGGVSSGVMNLITLTKNLLIGLIVMIYLLNIKESLSAQGKKFIYSILPLKAANIVVGEFRFIKKAFSGFIIGKLIDSLIIGILCFILMNLFKLPYELLISVIIGVFWTFYRGCTVCDPCIPHQSETVPLLYRSDPGTPAVRRKYFRTEDPWKLHRRFQLRSPVLDPAVWRTVRICGNDHCSSADGGHHPRLQTDPGSFSCEKESESGRKRLCKTGPH